MTRTIECAPMLAPPPRSLVGAQMHGCGVVSSAVGAAMTAGGLMGLGLLFSMAGMTAFLLGSCAQLVRRRL